MSKSKVSKLTLARYALGLPNDNNKSCRNMHSSHKLSPYFSSWLEMVTEGKAVVAHKRQDESSFSLTRDGALWAIEANESLCPDDFPEGDQS